MNKLLKNEDLKLIFLSWRIFLFLPLLFAVNLIPLQDNPNFLGGGLKNYLVFPYLFSWANFDGEHYLAIAKFGYKGLEQAFFPIFPLLVSLVKPISSGYFLLTSFALLISNVAFLASLFALQKLITLDYKKETALWVVICLLVFPTSFFFGAVYNEGLFLLFSVLAFYFARKQKWFFASVLGGVASATRIFGLFLLPAFLIELYLQKRSWKNIGWFVLIPLGLSLYMFYQWLTVGDPLAFYHLQKIVGEQHQSGLTLLPQVYFRYLKILLTTSPDNPIFQTIILELIIGISFFVLPIIGFFQKIRWSYLFYALISFLTPTIQGSFSSVPRYVLVFFPSFLVLALILEKMPKWVKISYIFLSTAWLFIETSLYLRGYWVA